MKSESLFLCLTGHMAMLKRKTWNKCANLQLIKKILTEKNRKMLTKCGRIQMKKSKFNWMIELWIVVLFKEFYKNTTVQSVSLNFSDLLSCLCGFSPAAIISHSVFSFTELLLKNTLWKQGLNVKSSDAAWVQLSTKQSYFTVLRLV